MIYSPEFDCHIPNLDILTLLFESSYPWAADATPIYAEAANATNKVTRAEIATLTRRLARVFRDEFAVGASGPAKDVVTCFSSNHLLLPTIFFGVIAAGGIYAAASTALTVPELARQLGQTNSRMLVTSKDTAPTALEAAQQCGISPENVLILQPMGTTQALTRSTDPSTNYFNHPHQLPWERITDPATLATRVVALLFSSGTTGIPKGVQLSQQNFVAESMITQAATGSFLRRIGRQPGVNFEYRTLAHLPCAHIAGLQGYFINGIMDGGTVFWMPKFVFDDFVAAAQKHKLTFLSTVPSVYLNIVKSPKVTDQFHSLVHAQSGAAPMGAELQKLAESKLTCNIGQAWGLTETTGSVTWMPWRQPDPTGSIGRLLPNTRMKIVDDNDVSVPDGERGEILIKGPNVTMGYFRNPEGTKQTFTTDGWLRTGDIGLHRNGLFYIVDRKKELIKYKGLQIAPAEIEALLQGHERIMDAAVVGIPDPGIPGNEVPRAFVVRKPARTAVTEEEVKQYVRDNLAAHKQLRGGVEFIDQVPRNMSGKILRRILMDRVKASLPAKL